MINISFKNEELLDLYSILIKFSDRLDNQNILEIVHVALLGILEQVAPEKEDKQIENESCLEKVQPFKKWYNQQQVKIDELEKIENCDYECGENCCGTHQIIDALNTRCNGNIPCDYKTIIEKASEKLEFKDVLKECINDPITIQKAQLLDERVEEDEYSEQIYNFNHK